MYSILHLAWYSVPDHGFADLEMGSWGVMSTAWNDGLVSKSERSAAGRYV